MLDKRYLRENLETVKKRLESRGEGLKIDSFKEFDERRRALLQEAEALKERRNTVSHEIGALKKKGEDANSLMEEMRGVSAKIKALDKEICEVEADLADLLLLIPNLPNEAVPQGSDESDNRVLRTWHTPREFTFTPLEHTDIGTALGIIDLERAGRMSGARFSILKGAGARLERALINFMLDLHTDKQGYTEVLPPFMTKGSA
jgi:seryl-tRNA synthetase